ncbi:ribosomal RNA processing protein 1 homolog B [Danio aesculapii]|uniref:ribosomal RNA processing protein 1 homolog B n=1 Tax=Danio aesculapii TaxID=1142201 RepID=UPI0024C011CF|nr:ribosomal RNA processing protein 1 homolog B [Danio aesculapii]
MATQAAEVVFAQKLAANERSVRSKALLKLRKYIRIRSERAPGGFSEEELLKIWKGLFYCLWMQDLPVLQEELSTKISALLFSFRTVDSQFLFFKTFLQTMKREWNGIDRLRLDKFYQLVRFVFRQMFEMLKKQEWEPSVLQVFLQLFSDQLLQSSSAAPSGLTLHIMELYMTELGAIGAAELTAEQNLSLIEPFCRTMSKTRDRVLLKAIGSSIFSTIVDQVPFAIADLLREIGTTEDEDQDGESSGETQTNVSEENASHPGDLEDKGSAEAVLQFDYGASSAQQLLCKPRPALFHLCILSLSLQEAKDPALPVSTDRKMKKKFVLSQKKAPAPLFCKGLKNTRISAAAKTDRKKVTFGLKNNKTVEFRKSDRSALLSPDRLPFDPSRAPKSGVLKSPSPSSMKRPSAADFF